MNVVFNLPTVELEERFIAASAAAGFSGLAGHRAIGGIRASIYNAMTMSAVEELAGFMEDFQRQMTPAAMHSAHSGHITPVIHGPGAQSCRSGIGTSGRPHIGRSGTHLTGTANDKFVTGEFPEAAGTAGMKSIGADSDLSPHAKFATVVKPCAGIDDHSR